MAEGEESETRTAGKRSRRGYSGGGSVYDPDYAARDERQSSLMVVSDDGVDESFVEVEWEEAEELHEEGKTVYAYSEMYAMASNLDEDDDDEAIVVPYESASEMGSRAFVPADEADGGGDTSFTVDQVDGSHAKLAAGSERRFDDGLQGKEVPGEWASVGGFVGEMERFVEENTDVTPGEGGDWNEALVSEARRDGEPRVRRRSDGETERFGGIDELNVEFAAETADPRDSRKNVPDRVPVDEGEDEYVYFAPNATSGDQNLLDRERATYAALEQMGVAGPRHEFGETEDGKQWRAKEEVKGQNGKEFGPGVDADADYQTARDVIASNIIVGNWDMHEGNMVVTDDGQTKVIDLDRGADDLDGENGYSASGYGAAVRAGGKTIEATTGTWRKDAQEDVSERATELSRELVRTGQHRAVIQAAADVDERLGKNVAKNIALLAADEL